MNVTLLHLMTDNATLRCRDEGRGRWGGGGGRGEGRRIFISLEGSSRFSSRIKNLGWNSKGLTGGLLHPWALSTYSWVFIMGVCSQDNTHPGGTERSESRAFDSHVVERNKTGALVDLRNKGRSERNRLRAKERKKKVGVGLFKSPTCSFSDVEPKT